MRTPVLAAIAMKKGKPMFESNRKPSSAKGFTLIELMIVVAVVAILAAIAIPSYEKQVRKSRRGLAKADLVQLAQSAERYFTINSTYATYSLPFNTSPQDAGGMVFYNLSFDGVPTSSAFKLQAVPTGVQSNDECGTLAIDQSGKKYNSSGSNGSCW